jgi:diaminopimelate epimerase
MEIKGLKFSKLQGIGNSFIFVDLRNPERAGAFQKLLGPTKRAKFAQQICDPAFGIGADGLVLLQNSTEDSDGSLRVSWDFYNSDGSKAEMCGNAARCVGLFLFRAQGTKTLQLLTGAGPVRVTFQSEDQIEVEMPKLTKVSVGQSLRYKGRVIKYDFVNSGVPHAVIIVKKLKLDDSLRELARFFQKHSRFKPKSTNVTFLQKSSGKILAASFERGVEDFTKACGTGAVAAAFCFWLGNKSSKSLVKVQLPGGLLQVDLSGDRPLLQGPARWIADFQIEI